MSPDSKSHWESSDAFSRGRYYRCLQPGSPAPWEQGKLPRNHPPCLLTSLSIWYKILIATALLLHLSSLPDQDPRWQRHGLFLIILEPGTTVPVSEDLWGKVHLFLSPGSVPPGTELAEVSQIPGLAHFFPLHLLSQLLAEC